MTDGLAVSDDASTREIIRASLDESVIVEAAAGTGKTSELVRRIVEVLSTGRTTVDRIVAVTFTRKAAGELKLRLRRSLDAARVSAAQAGDTAAAQHLSDALARLEEAYVGTIHSFCADILRERPVEARVDPAFEEASDAEARRIYRQAFRSWLEKKLAGGSVALRRIFSRLVARSSSEGQTPSEQLLNAGWAVIEWRDFDRPWARDEFDLHAELDALVDRVLEIDGFCSRCKNPDHRLLIALRPVQYVAGWIGRAERVAARDYDALEGLMAGLAAQMKRPEHSKKGEGRWFAPGLPRSEVLDARDRLLSALQAFDIRSGCDLAAALRSEMRDLIDRYRDLKQRAGKLDFVDLLVCTRDLLRGNAHARNFLQQRFTHLFVDEFQDTDPLQAEILLLLASRDPAVTDWSAVTPEPGKLFLVGDPKQSIYRFRRADVILYQLVRDELIARGVRLVRLTRSFRSVPGIQRVVNAAFAPLMNGDRRTGQPEYVPLEPYRSEPAPPAVVALPLPFPYGSGGVTKAAIQACLPETVIAYVEWLLRESGWLVSNPDDPDQMIPMEPRHIAILFRKFVSWDVDLALPYTRELEARGIPYLLAGARSFHTREEVSRIRAAVAAIEWPDDELSVFATLKGPLFAIPDEVLLRFRTEIGSLHPFRRVDDAVPEFRPLVDALAVLAELHRNRNHRPIAATISQLLEAVRAHTAFALWPAGNQALASVHRVVDLARVFEQSGGISFRGFSEELEQGEAERDAEPAVIETAAEGVRLMSVHAAKGLEFPVVVLAEITTSIAARNPERFIAPRENLCVMRIAGLTPRELIEHQQEEHDRDVAEGVRVAYVAATRARDLLIIPAVGDEPVRGWTEPLNTAIYPDRRHRREAIQPRLCPPFGRDTVLRRPANDFSTTPDDSVQPGLHTFGGYDVVWWDPGRLQLGVPANFGLRHEVILEASHSDAARQSVRDFEDWKVRREATLDFGAQPEFEIVTPTRLSEAPPGPPIAIETVALPRAAGRPFGTRFGALVHTVLREIPFGSSFAVAASLARLQGRILGATELEMQSAAQIATEVLRHPLMRRAQAAEKCHREMPIIFRFDDGRIVEGTIDLAFVETGTWNVVDFKTDADPQIGRYNTQLAWYVYALSRVTGLYAQGWLLSL